jgi:RNase P/RNase MRP subunit p30
MSTPEALKEKFVAIASKRELLVQLSLKDNLGSLSIDVMQALEELDDLLMEIRKIFPDWQHD